jgi:hypothetical protein
MRVPAPIIPIGRGTLVQAPYSFRLGSGVQLWEVAGSSVLLVTFLALEFALIGGIFESNILSTGQPPTWDAIIRMILRKNGQAEKIR